MEKPTKNCGLSDFCCCRFPVGCDCGSSCFAWLIRSAGCFLWRDSHRNAGGLSLEGVTKSSMKTMRSMNSTLKIHTFGSVCGKVWNRDHPISDEGVSQTQHLREKISKARPAIEKVCLGRDFESPLRCSTRWFLDTEAVDIFRGWSEFSVSWWSLSLQQHWHLCRRCDGPGCFHIDDEDMRPCLCVWISNKRIQMQCWSKSGSNVVYLNPDSWSHVLKAQWRRNADPSFLPTFPPPSSAAWRWWDLMRIPVPAWAT